MRSSGISTISWPCGADTPVRVAASSELCLEDLSRLAFSSAISPGTGGVCGTIAGPVAGTTTGATLPGTTGGGTTAGETAVAGAAATTRGPDGNSQSSPRPSARRFSAGLCSSMAAIHLSYMAQLGPIYRVTIYFLLPN